ncbi:MAG: hypothetical protein JRE40_10115 [Deltaproteobacteria bacterium]|nr:hypothetical protein [Deltaproteobacteria bacterium]
MDDRARDILRRAGYEVGPEPTLKAMWRVEPLVCARDAIVSAIARIEDGKPEWAKERLDVAISWIRAAKERLPETSEDVDEFISAMEEIKLEVDADPELAKEDMGILSDDIKRFFLEKFAELVVRGSGG